MRHVCSNKETRGGAQRIAPMAATDSWKPGSAAHEGSTASIAVTATASACNPCTGRPATVARLNHAYMRAARTAGAAAPVRPTYATMGTNEATTPTTSGARKRRNAPTSKRWNSNAAIPTCNPLTAIRWPSPAARSDSRVAGGNA